MRLSFIPWSIAGVPSSQALPGYLITAPPFVCVPDVIGALACGFQTQKKKTNRRRSMIFPVLFQQTNKQTNEETNIYTFLPTGGGV